MQRRRYTLWSADMFEIVLKYEGFRRISSEKIIGNNVPINADIVYGFNAVDVIRNNNININELTSSLQSSFADTLVGSIKKLKRAFDFSNIAIMNAPPTAAPTNDGLHIDVKNSKLYIAASGMWFTINLAQFTV